MCDRNKTGITIGANFAPDRGGERDLLTFCSAEYAMRRPVCLVLLAFVAACNMPGPHFRGVVPVRVEVGQSAFDVRIAGLWAQAIRLSPEWAPRPAAVVPRAVSAIERVSACRVVRIGGDQAVLVAQLDCGTGPPPRPPPVFICAVEDLGKGEADLICRPWQV